MKNSIFKTSLLVVLFMITFIISGCNEESTDSKQSKQTEKAMEELNRQVGMPNIINFQQKKLMKLVLELCDKESMICYAYIKSDYRGELVFIGKCIGFGIPFSAQFTNPERIIRWGKNSNSYAGSSPSTMPQPDPNGLFMPTSSSATWLMMINPETNKPSPVYLEPEIVVSSFPLHRTE